MSGFSTLLENIISENATDLASGFVTKAMINKHLKDHHRYGFIKGTGEGPGGFSKDVKISSEKGVRGGSHSPMNVTNASERHTEETVENVKNSLKDLGGSQHPSEDNSVVFNPGTKKEFKTTIGVQSHQTHVGNRYDPGYRTDWVVLRHSK